MDEIEAALTRYISTEIIKRPKFVLKPDEALLSSGLVDSFHVVDLAVYIEDTFGVHFDDTELNADTFDSVSQLAQLIRQRQK